ncbi:MAG: transposase [Halobacteriovoraceae bacterium]|nr:transposase [Halobacteriovoraceae bacterium]
MISQIKNLIEFPDLPILKYDHKATLKSLKNGDIKDAGISCKEPIDHIVNYGLDEGLLQEGLKAFPDPRKNFEVPIEVLLLPQIIQRLNDEHSLVSAPYMLNSAELITKLGYSAEVLENGFNERNIHPRETAFHGETLKHVLLAIKPSDIIDWFNHTWSSLLQKHSPGKTGIYIMDGMKIHIPPHLFEKFQNAGVVKNNDGDRGYGYKVVWIYEVIDRKGVIRGVKFGPINDHDLKLGKELVDGFDFGNNALLIMDRGFTDASWITSLKQDRGIDVCIPLKRNMELSELAVWNTLHSNEWEDHPTRDGQQVRELESDELVSKSCPVWGSGVLVKFKKKNGNPEFIVILDTRKRISSKDLLETYDLRSEIEESHRQMKCFQGMETLPSKKYVQVVFRVLMGLIGYNLFNLFLNSEGCSNFKDYTLKLFRQKRKVKDKNPDIIVYTETTFTVVKTFDFIHLILGLNDRVQEKLRVLFKDLSTVTAYGTFFGPSP